MESRIMKIRAKRQELDAQAIKKQNERENTIKGYEDSFRWIAPRIKELMEIAYELMRNDIPLGERRQTTIGSYRDDFVAEGFYHSIGFFPVYNKGEYSIIGIGIIGGGCCGNDLAIDESGNIIKNPLSRVFARWTYDNAYYDFCEKCKQFLDSFDEFEKRVYDYVDNL